MSEFHIVAALAELGHFLVKEPGMVAAMDLMADKAALLYGRMGPYLRSPLFRMAFVTKIIYGISFYHRLDVKTPVWIVAIVALYLTFSDRVVRLLVRLSPDVPVTFKARLRLFSL